MLLGLWDMALSVTISMLLEGSDYSRSSLNEQSERCQLSLVDGQTWL